MKLDADGKPLPPPPLSEADRARLAAFDEREGFFVAGGDFPISPTMAGMLHYAEPLHKIDLPEGAKSEVSEAESLEEMRR